MAKEVINAARFRDPIQADIGPDRQLFVLGCDDGSVYEFQKLDDAPIWNLRGRGARDKPMHQWTSSGAPLPADVTEALDEILGGKRWTK